MPHVTLAYLLPYVRYSIAAQAIFCLLRTLVKQDYHSLDVSSGKVLVQDQQVLQLAHRCTSGGEKYREEEKMDKMHAQIVTRSDIQSSLTPSYQFKGIRVKYPTAVVAALIALYEEYNRAFAPLVAANREWGADYHYSLGTDAPINWIVQIDMLGLTNQFLEAAALSNEVSVRDVLRSQIFEIENSWALYQLLGRVCDRDGEPSFYARRTRALQDSIRRRFGKPIALLAVTEQKYGAMRATEFGKSEGEPLPDAEVQELSGFDVFFGPEEFRRQLRSDHGHCRYLLYVRASDPVEKLKNPGVVVKHPLLGDAAMRQVIKCNSITFNVDDPAWAIGDPRRINDTKRYMPLMRMAHEIADEEGLGSLPFHPARVLRAKPVQGTYGCYGHVTGTVADAKFRKGIRRGTRDRGPYLVQPEHEAPTFLNTFDVREYAYIDRVFIGMMDGPEWLGGFRECLPSDSEEAKAGRLHGNKETVFAEIW